MQPTMVRQMVRVVCAGILCAGWAALVWAQSSTSIDRQTQVFWNSVETVLGKYDQETVRKVRVAGVGSWMSGEAGELSDIDATLARVSEMGGRTLVPKTRISEEHGHFALFLDNVGNRLGLWSSS